MRRLLLGLLSVLGLLVATAPPATADASALGCIVSPSSIGGGPRPSTCGTGLAAESYGLEFQVLGETGPHVYYWNISGTSATLLAGCTTSSSWCYLAHQSYGADVYHYVSVDLYTPAGVYAGSHTAVAHTPAVCWFGGPVLC